MGRLHGSDASLAMKRYRRTSALKTMNDRYSTTGPTQTKVAVYNRNGARFGYVAEDQDGFDGVERASIGELEMVDNGMESNDGFGMDQEWKQGLSMMEGIKFATQIGKALNCALEPLPGSPPNHTNKPETVRNHALRGFGRSRSPTNLTNQSETVRKYESASSERLVRKSTPPNLINQSLYLPDNHMEHINKSHSGTGKKMYEPETVKSRAWDPSFGGIDSVLCNRALKHNTLKHALTRALSTR